MNHGGYNYSNYIEFVKARQKHPPISRLEKCPNFPTNHMVVSGKTLLRSLAELPELSETLVATIEKIIGSEKGVSLTLSWGNYFFLRGIYEGYLSEKEQVILRLNQFLHEGEWTAPKKIKRSFVSLSSRRMLAYIDFIHYLWGLNKFIEYGEEISLEHYIKWPKRFNFDPELKSFCQLINYLLTEHKKKRG